MICRSYWIHQRRRINSRVIFICISCSLLVSVIVFCSIMVFAVAAKSTPLPEKDQLDAIVVKSEPIEDLLKSLLRPFPQVNLHNHPKDLAAAKLAILPDNKIESLIADPRPQSWTILADNKDELPEEDRKPIKRHDIEPQLIEDLPVQIMVQSSDVHNNYTVDHQDESSEEAIIEALEAQTTAGINSTEGDKEMVSQLGSTTLTPTQEISITTTMSDSLSSTETHQTIPMATPSSTTEAITEQVATSTTTGRTTIKPSKEVKKDNRPSLDKIAETLADRYMNHEDIASYEDVWYDDNGDLLWSAEEINGNGKNVKRQVNNVVRPVPLNQPDATRQEVERLQKVTDVIDRFRSMLDIAQQVDAYFTKRLQVGINALAAMYNEG